MLQQRTTLILLLFYFLLIIAGLSDTYLARDESNRVFAIIIQAIILVLLSIYFIINYSVKSIPNTRFHARLYIFIFLLAGYAMFSSYITRFPVCILAISSFFLFYYAAYMNYINLKHLRTFSIILLVIYTIQTYNGFINRSIQFNDFFLKADNTGYRVMYLMLVLSIFTKNIKYLIVFSFAFLLVIISLKRGAILIACFIFLISFLPLIRGKLNISKKTKQILQIGIGLIFIFVVGLLIYYWDIVVFRFAYDDSSGRDIIYYKVYAGWENGDLLNKLFGFGFYQVDALLGGGY